MESVIERRPAEMMKLPANDWARLVEPLLPSGNSRPDCGRTKKTN